MGWRHYETRQSDDCEAEGGQGRSLLRYDMGIVETGRSRVFAGHFVRLRLRNDEQITGEDEHSLRAALWRLARNIEPLGLILNCVGLRAEFSESGLSVDTGWGYWGSRSVPMHMMDPLPPVVECPDDLDRIIREAVDSMQINLSVMPRPAPDQHGFVAPHKAEQGQGAPPSNRRAPSMNPAPAYSVRSAPRTPR
jgi:hypothetical protein